MLDLLVSLSSFPAPLICKRSYIHTNSAEYSMNATNFVSYIRVSTTEQGESGLGLEAQRQTVSEYLARESGKLLCEFVEVESGSRNDRAQLQAAIELCKRYKATLLIAKLDRLARNVAFISRLMEIAAF